MDSDLIFISYASPDRERVLPHFAYLKQRGFNAWMDRKLLGGQNWDYEIRRALDKAAMIVMFVSHNSVNRRGYVQREIKLALNKLEEKLIGDIYIIPVLLDEDAQKPDQLSDLQFLNSTDDLFHEQLVEAIEHQSSEAVTASVEWANEAGLAWSKSIVKEEWSGLPGYSLQGEVIHLSSSKYSNLGDCADVIKGWFKTELLELRRGMLEQNSQFHNYGQPRERRTNSWDAYVADPVVNGRIISIKYTVGWYNAGAAHPNYGFRAFNFFLEPFCMIGDIQELFGDPDAAFSVIQEFTRRQLLELTWDDDGNERPVLLQDMVEDGTKEWKDFSTFTFGAEGIEFLFSPYQVGPYAAGSHITAVPYSALVKHMSEIFRSALDLHYFDRQPAGISVDQ